MKIQNVGTGEAPRTVHINNQRLSTVTKLHLQTSNKHVSAIAKRSVQCKKVVVTRMLNWTLGANGKIKDFIRVRRVFIRHVIHHLCAVLLRSFASDSKKFNIIVTRVLFYFVF